MQTDMEISSKYGNWEVIPPEAKSRVFDCLHFAAYLTIRSLSTSFKQFADQNSQYWSRQFSIRFGNFEQLMTDIERMEEYSPYITSCQTNYFQIYRLALKTFQGFSKFHFPEPVLILAGSFSEMAVVPSTGRRAASLLLIDESPSIKKINPSRFISPKGIAPPDWYASFKLSEQPSCICFCGGMLFVGTEKGNVFVYKLSNDKGDDTLDLISIMHLGAKAQSIKGSAKEDKIGIVIVSEDFTTKAENAAIYLLDKSSYPLSIKRIRPDKNYLVSGPFFGSGLLLYCPMQGGGILVYDLDMLSENDETMVLKEHIKDIPQSKNLLQLKDHLLFATSDGRLGWVEAGSPSKQPRWLTLPLLTSVTKITPIKEMGFCLHGEKGERLVFLRQKDNTYSRGYPLTPHMDDPLWMENGKVVYRSLQTGQDCGIYMVDLSQTWIEEVLKKIQRAITAKTLETSN